MTHPLFVPGAGIAILGAALLLVSITRTLALVKDSVVARLPAVAQQEVDFAQAGDFILQLEQPRLGMALNRAQFSLRDSSGREAPSSPVIFRTTTSGLSTSRISVRSFSIEFPGRYRLTMTDIAPAGDRSRCALIFTRPFGAALFAWIVGMVLGGAGLVGGIVLTSLALAGKLR